MESNGGKLHFLMHPNTLTLYRIFSVPAIVGLLLIPNRVTCFLAALLFSVAAITDYLDGYLARRHGMVSNLGKFLDPLADKLMVVSPLIMLAWLQWVSGWIVVIIVGRELAVTGLRGIAAEKGVVIAAERLGKLKTGFQIAAIIPLLLNFTYFEFDFHGTGTWLLWLATLFTVVSGASYFYNFYRVIRG